MNPQNKQKKKGPSLSTYILIGLTLGVLTGLFLGEPASGLAIVGKAYVGLLQMSILPYMVVSLIAGIGALNYEKAINLAVTGGLVLAGSWLLAFGIIFVLPLAFPPNEGGTFYSPSLVQVADVDFIDLYIPVNPFSSLARTVVPAAAVFSVLLGIALIGIEEEKKKGFLDVMSTLSHALTRIAMLIVKLTPFGVFAIAANAAGTMTVEEFGRLQTYIVTFIVATLLLTFWILPGLVSVLTPFSYRDTLRASRDALVTGFVTGNLFIVLPLLIENGKKLFQESRLASEDTDSFVEVLVPTSFNFPNVGKLLTLLFVLFAGWFTGKQMGLGEYPMFSTLGLFTLFGGVDLALPFLLDQMRIPSDLYQLYVVTGVVNGWFATLIAVMNLFAFTLVATCAAVGALRVSWPRVIQFVFVTTLLLGATIMGTRYALSVMVSEADIARQTLMQARIATPAATAVYKTVPESLQPTDVQKPRIPQILDRGTLRVGYNKDNLPFAFLNERGELVGYDVELMHVLARQLGVSLEFVPWTYDTLFEQLGAGEFDLVAGGILVTTPRLAQASFSEPYLTVTASLVVPDHRRREFTDWEDIKQKAGLKIGVTVKGIGKRLEDGLPLAEVKHLDSFREFFTDNPHGLDAILISAETGSAWTILYPRFAVAIPEPHVRLPIALAMARGDRDLLEFIDDWLRLQRTGGTLERLYDTWILGKGTREERPRWSVIRDVLHWVD